MTSCTDKMSAGYSRAAHMREYKKRKRLEEGNCNNIREQTKFDTDGNSRAAYMKEYTKKRKWLGEGNCNIVPKRNKGTCRTRG
jgi:hypothetical protein